MPSNREKKMIELGIKKSELTEFLRKRLDRYGFGGCEISLTPLVSRIVVYLVDIHKFLGSGEKKRIILEEEIAKTFSISNPKIEIREVENPYLNAYIVVRRIGRAIERGINYKRVANFYLRKVMDAGAVGVLIKVSGKIAGKERSRFQKFKDGYIIHSGNYKETLVDEAHYRASIPHGIVGVTVKILKEVPQEFIFEKELNATS